MPLVEGASDDEGSDAEPSTAFDDAEDAELIAASKKRQLKAQGVNVKATKAFVATKGATAADEPPKKKAKKASA